MKAYTKPHVMTINVMNEERIAACPKSEKAILEGTDPSQAIIDELINNNPFGIMPLGYFCNFVYPLLVTES